MNLSDRIGLDYLTMVGASPLHFIRTAAEAGCRHVALWPEQADYNPYGLPHFSLIEDAALRRDTVACLDDHGVSIALIDAFFIKSGQSVEQHRRCFEIFAELGVRRVNAVSIDPSWERTIDEMAALVAMATEYNATVVVESCPLLTIGTLAQAIELINIVSMPNFKLLIDTMHVTRSGETEALADIDPVLIDYVQISDGAITAPSPEAYMEEAMSERLIPGDGEMPLVKMLRTIRPSVVVSGEVPMRSLRDAGVSDLERSKMVIAGIRQVLELAR